MMTEPPIKLSRQELYDLVWSEPMSTAAPKLGMSDRGVAKICERLDVPRPPRGYWQKKRAGQKVRRPPLRPLPDGARTPSIARIAPRRARGLNSQAVSDVREFESRPENAIKVPDNVRRYHALVRATRASLRAKRSSTAPPRGARESVPGLDVDVTKESETRALRIMHELIRALEKRGNRVTIDASTGSTCVDLGDVAVKIRLTEKRRRIELPPTTKELADEKRYGWRPFKRYDFVSTGKLVLSIDEWLDTSRKSWADGKKQRVEECLNDFIVGLACAAEAKRIAAEERQARHEELVARQRREAEVRELRQREQTRFDDLRERAERWEMARQMRRFVAAVERVARAESPERYDDAAQWFEWAKRRLERMDPLSDIDQLLSELTEQAPADSEFRVIVPRGAGAE